jgi:hypothetical protein
MKRSMKGVCSMAPKTARSCSTLRHTAMSPPGVQVVADTDGPSTRSPDASAMSLRSMPT